MADYIAGLSGGSWAVGSLAINNWPTTQALNDEVWNLEENLVIPENGKVKFYASLVADVKQKRDLGYNTAITDYWGLALASHLLNSSATASTTFSDIVNTTNFMNAAYPFPVIIADEREPGELLISGNTSQWEFNALETGT